MAGRLIADARNWLNHAMLHRAGFHVIVLGNGQRMGIQHQMTDALQ